MSEPSWNDSVRSAQASMRAPELRRFYERVEVGEAEGGFAVLLDGRRARTPGKLPLIAPARGLAEHIAEEWKTQADVMTPAAMPFTRLANSALDGVARAIPETVAVIAGFGETDLLCYRATEPEKLAERQARAFDPILTWAENELSARFALAGGIMPTPQPPGTLAAVKAAVEAEAEPFALTALHGLTSLSGSVLIALAMARGALGAEAAWAAAHVDEDFQIELWGADEEAMFRRAARWRDFTVAAATLDALKGPAPG